MSYFVIREIALLHFSRFKMLQDVVDKCEAVQRILYIFLSKHKRAISFEAKFNRLK